MSYTITEYDKNLILQGVLRYYVKIEILNENGTVYGELIGTVVGSGSASIDASSHNRRQFSIVLSPTEQSIDISQNNLLWINKEAKMSIMIYSFRDKSYHEYPFGKFIFANMDGAYNATTNQLTVNGIDFYAKLDGTQNGQFGTETTIPAYDEDSSGTPTRYNTIEDALIKTITQVANIDKYNIGDIGEYMAMPQYNTNWKTYRAEHPNWNYIPYDLEFSRGDYVSSMIDKMVNLYPNYDYFFDETGILTVKMIPSSYEDSVLLDYDYIKKVLVADNTESSSIVPTSVRNICEVWGQTIDTDYYSDTVTKSGSIYNITCSGYESYSYGDKLAIKVPSTNDNGQYIKVGSLSSIQIYDEGTDTPISASVFESGKVYSFRYYKSYVNGSYIERFYYLGQWEVHAMNVITDGTVITNGYTYNGTTIDKYSKKYFQTVYNCNSVELTVIPDSPFTVQKIGERLDTKMDSEYEDITSDSMAIVRAKYENWINCRLTDTITITTILMPWITDYQKIEYKRANSDEINQYITQNISHDLSSCTTTITAYRFYPLYNET